VAGADELLLYRGVHSPVCGKFSLAPISHYRTDAFGGETTWISWIAVDHRAATSDAEHINNAVTPDAEADVCLLRCSETLVSRRRKARVHGEPEYIEIRRRITSLAAPGPNRPCFCPV
jgi:hypothetical protein